MDTVSVHFSAFYNNDQRCKDSYSVGEACGQLL
jgi:hypothetical protein